jgi:hypothetical protein
MVKIFIGFFEISTLALCIYFGYQWANHPNGNYEPWLFLGSLAFVTLEICRRYEIHFIKRREKSFTPGELLKHSEDLKKKFQEEIYKCRVEKLRKDVIIRDADRIKAYPNVDVNPKGISPWFKAGLISTYHRGIMVALRSGTLTESPDGYRFTDYKIGEKGDIRVYLIGKIPYEFIEGVDFDGDEYYYLPHIYCRFANKGEPYEELVYCEEVEMGNGHLYYSEREKYQNAKDNSVGFGVEYFA